LKNSLRWLLSCLSGILLVAAWPDYPFTWLIFVAWIPILFLAVEPTRKITWFGQVFLTMLIWNTGTTCHLVDLEFNRCRHHCSHYCQQLADVCALAWL